MVLLYMWGCEAADPLSAYGGLLMYGLCVDFIYYISCCVLLLYTRCTMRVCACVRPCICNIENMFIAVVCAPAHQTDVVVPHQLSVHDDVINTHRTPHRRSYARRACGAPPKPIHCWMAGGIVALINIDARNVLRTSCVCAAHVECVMRVCVTRCVDIILNSFLIPRSSRHCSICARHAHLIAVRGWGI